MVSSNVQPIATGIYLLSWEPLFIETVVSLTPAAWSIYKILLEAAQQPFKNDIFLLILKHYLNYLLFLLSPVHVYGLTSKIWLK